MTDIEKLVASIVLSGSHQRQVREQAATLASDLYEDKERQQAFADGFIAWHRPAPWVHCPYGDENQGCRDAWFRGWDCSPDAKPWIEVGVFVSPDGKEPEECAA